MGENEVPKYQKNLLFGKDLPHRGEPLDWFLKFLRAFTRSTIQRLKFDLIRFTSYEIIAEKPRVGHLG